MYQVEHLKSGLSISTYLGCNLNCSYCILGALGEDTSKPKQIATVEDLENLLFNENSLYLPNRTPLIVNNRTDPFLPEVAETTYDILDMLTKHNVKSPILIITKLVPDLNISYYSNRLNLMVFLSYSGLKRPFEPNRNFDIIDKFCERVPKKSRYHYFRPLIEGANDNEETITRVLEHVVNKFSATVTTGLRIVPPIVKRLKERANYELKVKNYNPIHKFLKDETINNIWQIRTKLNENYPIFRHTSCAVAFHLGKPNSQGYVNKEYHCDPNCKLKAICKKFKPNLDDDTINYIHRHTDCNFTVQKNEIIFYGSISQEFKASLRLISGLNIKADRIELSPSEREFLET
ncbi:hypothetical protein M1585_01310 [Candidatus Parvarchaeota archaeon]|nr:hypothetical protein [Candidatus Parvarchaeota archaeon]